MKMNGEIRVPTDRETVWRALNDPEVLKDCLPGCQEIEKTSDTEMTATLVIKVGPVKATFAAVSRSPISTRPTAIRSPARAKGVPPASPRARPRSGWSPTAANGRAIRRRCEGRRQAGADRLAPHRFHRKEALQTVLRQPCREAGRGRRRGSRDAAEPEPEPAAPPSRSRRPIPLRHRPNPPRPRPTLHRKAHRPRPRGRRSRRRHSGWASPPRPGSGRWSSSPWS